MIKGTYGKPGWFNAVKEEYKACKERVCLVDMSSFTKIEIKVSSLVLHIVISVCMKTQLLLKFLHQNIYSRLSLSRSQRDPLKHFEISVLQHIRCAELRKIPNEQPNFTNEHVI